MNVTEFSIIVYKVKRNGAITVPCGTPVQYLQSQRQSKCFEILELVTLLTSSKTLPQDIGREKHTVELIAANAPECVLKCLFVMERLTL